ncbi:MAG: DNA polymerase III subunit delta [Paludibacteraceae bacterium]|nr:DNA polymerase III subunit delta [Paludibacteraceae bacterium]
MSTYDEILQNLKRGNFAPIYFLYGEESYYIDKLSDYIEQNILDEMSREFDQMVLYGKDYERDMGPIISAARRFPMMGHQVIIVKEAQLIRSWEPLANYLKQMQPTTMLVFCYKHGKIDKRLKVFKELEEKGGVLMESSPLRDSQVQGWILNYIRDWNKQKGQEVKISEQIVMLLAESLGTDLTKIVGALQKLIDGRPEGVNEITAELVERNIGISKDYNIFELEKALTIGDVLKANRIVRYFAQNTKQHAIQKEIVVLFGWFQNLMVYHYLPDKSEPMVAKALGINPYFVKDYRAAAQRFNAMKVFRIIGYIRQADAKSKGFECPNVDEMQIWQELIYKILH